ncbi:hypothetical protein C8J57DRAFT_610542 [Mycena rebaudengoi]|nr:hypothetical protein C8J57DRAFT_610542 [Mycena rebaudengoi]
MNLDDLVQDVLIYILELCGIAGVMAFPQTNRYFRLRALDRPLWVALVQNLTNKLLRDPLPDEQLQKFSPAELIQLAACAARGPETWVSTLSNPVISREIRIPCELLAQTIDTSVKLLPGGQFVVVARRSTVQCWHVAERRLVGEYNLHSDADMYHFAAEIVDGRGSVLIFLHTGIWSLPRRRWLELVKFSLSTGVVENLHIMDAHSFWGNHWFGPNICGDIASILISVPQRWGMLLLNHTSDTYILLEWPQAPQIHYQRPHTALVPAHIIIATPSSASSIQFVILHTEALRAHWRPLHQIDWDPKRWTALASIPPLVGESPPLDLQPFPDIPIIRLAVYENPLKDATYNIRVHAWPLRNSPPISTLRRIFSWNASDEHLPRATLFSSSLSIASNAQCIASTGQPTHAWTWRDPVLVKLPNSFPDIPDDSGEYGSHHYGNRYVSLTKLMSRDHIFMTQHSGALSWALPYVLP